ncbi:hypothetical protein EV702DRAFT_294129 [Suillus placidus]|uniref:Uncharacterized protein n=1 Tax=Suillus placidus TaxID=48579 RepID=A0A9P7CV85_9AGAM|nr:hypothetical protein EV702DRAFT_294129 [Suillus placidus]
MIPTIPISAMKALHSELYIKHEHHCHSPSLALADTDMTLNMNMTLLSNNPSWWPLINMNRFFSYFIGSWGVCRIVLVCCLDVTLNMVLQLHPLLWCYTGVSIIVLIEKIINILSIDIRTRGVLRPLSEQLSH